ncbi:MAG: hypothetical protein Q4G51_01360 [Dermatophilus congolensis]|nr:hypothetical protein [Dermatophilus congolensis]
MSALAVATSLVTLATAGGAQVVNHLPMPAWAYGAVALALGVLLLVFTWMFRHSAAAMIDGKNAHGAHGTHGAQGHGQSHGTKGSH